MTARCAPLADQVRLVSAGPDQAVATATVDPADPVFAGHFPGFPLLPGVYLVELVGQTVRAALHGSYRPELAALDRCRFLSPVAPGDELRIEVALTWSGPDLRCAATITTDRGRAADLRLRYRPEED
ncbi:3-hydroxyacyl-ACP dehydratase FabZ family protein [Plantactinospora soyae]|uniref:3-hydroxyacyl-[acyl-carrier-protein] dehydratase n=1 Tax=Plantactinospora soyae TaxID=1544732 RepID=A0A927MF74_9ACTN|nr:3-hydroxyacyl-ACP dehydratase FabZ family protein [Plantactinospora soyae]MBE1491991.1 3-hydroxyacyl-[acyl-carrier-protein] dehydratase [Plantactinospora soyae]